MGSPTERDRVSFGLDAPGIVRGAAGLGALGAVLLVFWLVRGGVLVARWGLWAVIVGGFVAGSMMFSSRVGKRRARDRALRQVGLRDGDRILDLGCGSGLMLLGAVDAPSSCHGVGVDLWNSRDQTDTGPPAIRRNAEILGLSGAVEIVTADMRDLPFDDCSFDVVLACLSLHNIRPHDGRDAAFSEALRMLRPGGRFAVIDIFGTSRFASAARKAGMRDVAVSGFVAGMFPPARLVTGHTGQSVVSATRNRSA